MSSADLVPPREKHIHKNEWVHSRGPRRRLSIGRAPLMHNTGAGLPRPSESDSLITTMVCVVLWPVFCIFCSRRPLPHIFTSDSCCCYRILPCLFAIFSPPFFLKHLAVIPSPGSAPDWVEPNEVLYATRDDQLNKKRACTFVFPGVPPQFTTFVFLF